MRPIRTQEWVAHNGHQVFVRFTIPSSQVLSPDNSLAFAFNQIDGNIRSRLKYICLSPETTPNPEGFRHETV